MAVTDIANNLVDETPVSFNGYVAEPPVWQNLAPAASAVDISISSRIYLEIIDTNEGVDAASVILKVNDVIVWQADMQQADYVVAKNTVTNGYSYLITPATYFNPYEKITMGVYAADLAYIPNILNDSYWFHTAEIAPDCFTGPSNAFETSLLVPYDAAGTTLYYTDILRSKLLTSVSTSLDPIRAIRQIYLRAFQGELASVLRNIVPAPTFRERTVKLCYKKTIIQIDAALRSKTGLLAAALTELRTLGLSVPHYQMLRYYLSTDEPNVLVPLACVMVVLAKVLETNVLV